MRFRQLRPNDITDHSVLDLIDGPPERSLSEEDMRPYQRWLSDYAYSNPYTFVAAGMGLGKTGASLFTARRLLDEGVVRKVLIVAPIRVAEQTWPEELRIWKFARGLSWSLLTGPEEEREAARLQDTEIHIVNRENLVWLWEKWRRNWPYDMLIYDEASRLKGAREKTKPTTRADGTVSWPRMSEFGSLTRARMYFDRIILLSGTPAPNGLKDLWGPFFILDKGDRLGRSKTAFLDRWFIQDPYSEYKIKPQRHAETEIMDRVADIMVSLRKEDYLTLPPVVPVDRWITLPKPILQKYRDFERTMIAEEYDVEAVNQGVLTNKLLQFANGSMYDTEKEARHIHDLKLAEMESIVEETAGEPLLIAYSFQFDLDRIKKKYPKFRIYGDSKNDMRDWNAGRIHGLLIHPASCGHGLNFQYGGSRWIWYGLNWSLELYQQVNERLPRSGQKASTTFMYRILAKQTEDVHMLSALDEKGATQDSITNRVRVRMTDIMRQVA